MADTTNFWPGAGSEAPKALPTDYFVAPPGKAPSDPVTLSLIPPGGGPANVRVLYGFLWRGPRKRDAWEPAARLAAAAKEAAAKAEVDTSAATTKKASDAKAAADKAAEAAARPSAVYDGQEDEVRLYTSWLLDEYIDLTDVPLRYWRKIPFDGGTIVWIDAIAQVAVIRVTQTRKAQSYLGGPIAETFLSGRPPEPEWEFEGGPPPPETALCSSSKCSPRRP